MISNFVIAIDTREQLPYFTKGVRIGLKRHPVGFQVKTLKTGDYSIIGHEDKIAVERKSLADFYGSITRGRERFEREVERLSAIPHRVIVIEATMDNTLSPELQGRRFSGDSVSATIASWEVKYGVHFHCFRDRERAETFTFHFFMQYWRHAGDATPKGERDEHK